MNSAFDRFPVPLTGDINNLHDSKETLSRPPRQTCSRGKILIVEDEPDVAALLERFLRNYGFFTTTAGDGLTACRLINALRPDLILLDIKLPELDGLEVCRLVRKIPDRNLASTPIMMLSALATQQHRDQGLKLGANDYMTKPYSLKEIVQRSIKLIDIRKTQQLTEIDYDRPTAS